MGHETFMAVFLKMILACMIREENDEYALRLLKFFGTFVASFGEEYDEDGTTHGIIQHSFRYILSVRFASKLNEILFNISFPFRSRHRITMSELTFAFW